MEAQLFVRSEHGRRVGETCAIRKKGLSSLLTDRHPDDETLSTVFAEVETLVNSRPLTNLPLESEELEDLTPNHFILLCSSGVVQPVPRPTYKAAALRASWHTIQFRKCWITSGRVGSRSTFQLCHFKLNGLESCRMLNLEIW